MTTRQKQQDESKPRRDAQAVIDFLKRCVHQGLLTYHAARNAWQVIERVLAAQSNPNFAARNPDVTESSLNTYRARMRTSINRFIAYRADPDGWHKEGGRTRKAETKAEPVLGELDGTNETLTLRLPFGEGTIVTVQGIPRRFSRAQVERFAEAMKLFAAD
jgi:hypothetical protein